jgi:hypothetical protein
LLNYFDAVVEPIPAAYEALYKLQEFLLHEAVMAIPGGLTYSERDG